MPVERQENCAVVFADMSGSTKLYVDVGDEQARVVVASTLDRWSAIVTARGGRVVQLRGDGMLCIFGSADDALRATMAMRDMPYPPSLSMHAGMNVGAALQEGEQLYGDAVNVAARMADIAKRFEIALTASSFEALSESLQPMLRLIRQVSIKGKPEPADIYLLPSPGPMLTEMRSQPAPSKTGQRLLLRYAEQLFTLDAASAGCLLGRDADCLVKVEHRLVSRRHASIEYKGGRFFLNDHSTNGTYIQEGGPPALVLREIYQLKGKGVISLGAEPANNTGALIYFTTNID